MKKNVILADCKAEEIRDFQEGLEETTGKQWEVISRVCNWAHDTKWKNFRRYLTYFTAPWHVFLHRNEYETIVGWQQFYANIFAFYCHLFRVKKPCKVVSANFTYKRKEGGNLAPLLPLYAFCGK